MTGSPSFTGKDLVGVLKKAGFQVMRSKGSHHFLRHGRTTIGPGLLSKILRDCDLTREELQALL